MRYNPIFYRWNPANTSTYLRLIIWITCSITFFAAILHNFFLFLHIATPLDVLGLSWTGLQHFYLWQPFTYLFVQQSVPPGIHFLFIVSVIINMYLLWLLGSMVEERIGKGHFLALYFGSGILSGLIALLAANYAVIISGPSAAILAVCMVWTMLHSESEITLFFLIPIQARWIMMSVLGALCLLSLSQGDFVSVVLYLSGVLYGYIYGLMMLDLPGPFGFSKGLDKILRKLGRWFSSFYSKGEKNQSASKIIDLRGKPVLDDDMFVDEMLAKIARHGEASLTRAERIRMDQISERKAREHRESQDDL